MSKYYYTSESVTEGHPDKVCDAIADGILDAMLAQDPLSRSACETIAEPGRVHIMGEVTTNAKVDYEQVAREVIRRIGYTNPEDGFDADSCEITCSLHSQSPDIAMGVDHAFDGEMDNGAGDQGMMYGYACDETPTYMPTAIYWAHKLTRRLAQVRKEGILDYLKPDGKAQVTVEYVDGKPTRIDAVVVSTQHAESVSLEQLRKDVMEQVIQAVLPGEMLDENTKYYINPTGRFVLGGPAADTGLTGRKIIVDTYGGYGHHGGGSFSGKDPSKVDRSATYMARYVAKNIVAAGLAKRCEIQVSYAIGVAQPISIHVDTFGTGSKPDGEIEQWVKDHYDLRPSAIIEKLDLRRPIYSQIVAYGHMGREDVDLPWEHIEAH